MPFKEKFGTFLFPGDFHFLKLVIAAFSLSAVMFFHSCSFTLSLSLSVLPIQLADIIQAFPSPHIPLQNFSILSFRAVSFTIICFFFPYFCIKFFGIRLEDFIFLVEYVAFIKLSSPLCFYLHFLL